MSTMDGQSIDLSSLGGPPIYSSPSTRASPYDDDTFLLPGSPKGHSPDIPDAEPAPSAMRNQPKSIYTRNKLSPTVSFAPSTPGLYYSATSPRMGANPSWHQRLGIRSFRPRWHPWYSMYILFLFGFLCASGHHIFYASLDGKPAGGESQLKMLRYGTILAYAAKSGKPAYV